MVAFLCGVCARGKAVQYVRCDDPAKNVPRAVTPYLSVKRHGANGTENA